MKIVNLICVNRWLKMPNKIKKYKMVGKYRKYCCKANCGPRCVENEKENKEQ